MKITKRQREVLDHLSLRGAVSRETASDVFGGDSAVADNLAANAVINKRYEAQHGSLYWIRGDGEAATGVNVPAGFVVILHKDLTTPSGRKENFFLARAPYDGKGATFRQLLRGWMLALGLAPKDLLGGAIGFQVVAADEPMFGGDHVLLDETSQSQPSKVSHARVRQTRADRIAHAEAEAARHLGDYNEHREAGRLGAAERSFWRSQRWLDRANDLRGQGS